MIKRPKYTLRGDDPELMRRVIEENGSSISIVVRSKVSSQHTDASFATSIHGSIVLFPDEDSAFRVKIGETDLYVYVVRSGTSENSEKRWKISATTRPIFAEDSKSSEGINAFLPFESSFVSNYELGLGDINVIIWE